MDPQVQITNNNLLNKLDSDDPTMHKEAAGGVSEFLRLRAREDGFARALLPPENVTPDQFTKQLDTPDPCIVKDMEPNSTGAVGIPFGTGASDAYMGAPRYRIVFHRLATDRYSADVANLWTYDMDLKDIFNDLMLKDLMDEEDRKFIGRIDSMVGDLNDTDSSSNDHLSEVGALGFVTAGPVSRESLFHAKKGLPATDRHLTPSRSLINILFVNDIAALGRDSMGGDIAEDAFVNGWTKETIAGLDTIVTIKTDLVADNTQYIFAAPKYMGDFNVAEDVTVSFKKEDYFVLMRAYEMIGMTIKNTASACKVQYTGSQTDWKV